MNPIWSRSTPQHRNKVLGIALSYIYIHFKKSKSCSVVTTRPRVLSRLKIRRIWDSAGVSGYKGISGHALAIAKILDHPLLGLPHHVHNSSFTFELIVKSIKINGEGYQHELRIWSRTWRCEEPCRPKCGKATVDRAGYHRKTDVAVSRFLNGIVAHKHPTNSTRLTRPMPKILSLSKIHRYDDRMQWKDLAGS